MRLSLNTVNILRGALAPSASPTGGGAGSTAVMPMETNVADKVQWPNYDPTKLTPGIVHVGVGNFHRSHFAAYMNDLLNDPETSNRHQAWGIVGTGVQKHGSKKKELLGPQDWLQTLVERDGTSAKASILAPMIDYTTVDPSEEKPFQELLLEPNIKIVSLTVTEGGYYMLNMLNIEEDDDTSELLDDQNPDIQHDIKNPTKPESVLGIMVHALKQRKDKGIPPFTVMSCDNIPHNGDVTRRVLVELASKMFPNTGLDEWIAKEGAFPNAMVDRITPGITDEMIDFVKKEYGYEDAAPVFCEPFTQWILEDEFVNGERPEWEKCESVTFVDDVSPYELMKIRILNGGHAALCYPSALLGLEFVHNAMEHPLIGPFLDKLERTEIIPTVGPVPNTNLEEYWDIIAERFSNPTINDTIERNCFDGSSRQPKFIVPVIHDALRLGTDTCVDGLALVSAFWCRYCQGTTESGEKIAPNAPNWDKLQEVAMKAKSDPCLWLDGNPDVYNVPGVQGNQVFRKAFEKSLTKVQNDGVEAALKAYIEA